MSVSTPRVVLTRVRLHLCTPNRDGPEFIVSEDPTTPHFRASLSTGTRTQRDVHLGSNPSLSGDLSPVTIFEGNTFPLAPTVDWHWIVQKSE